MENALNIGSPPSRSNAIRRVLVLGGGSAGFLAAITLKAKLPDLQVTVLRSREIGIIGVGEGSIIGVAKHLHCFLEVDTATFYRLVQPTWKLGVRFLRWGPRPYFDYSFALQLHARYQGLPKYTGYYCDDAFDDVAMPTALMSRNRAFRRLQNGLPGIGRDFAYHFENELLCNYLEMEARRRGVTITDGNVLEATEDDQGITGLRLQEGGTATADLYIDSSGFRSVLLGGALREPFVSFKSSLFCDRAVVGGWDRTAAEPIKPYTTAETMDHGWCWQIEHERRINRGYVYSSSFCADDAAEREFRAKNPKVQSTRIVKFVTGCYQRSWVKNVVAIGNAAGFVEPLEATSLGVICTQLEFLATVLIDCDRQPDEHWRRLINVRHARVWESIRRFLALHYRFNTRQQTPFWRECVQKSDLAGAEPVVEYYQHSGPTPLPCLAMLDQYDLFGAEGYLSMLVGQGVPYRHASEPTAAELQAVADIRRAVGQHAEAGVTSEEALQWIRRPDWVWLPQYFKVDLR
ncbi:MAG TPA: FAD-dependent oxidoreductase [Tepidisphaeraceae bacterium]|jgi:tryptophan halogenase